MTKEDCDAKEGVQWHEGKACNEVECPPPGGCNGKETISKAKCKTKRGQVKKVIVVVKKGTQGQKYTATLDTGQQLEKNAKNNGKAKFTFKGNNRPGCGPNGVTVCDQHKAFNCDC